MPCVHVCACVCEFINLIKLQGRIVQHSKNFVVPMRKPKQYTVAHTHTHTYARSPCVCCEQHHSHMARSRSSVSRTHITLSRAVALTLSALTLSLLSALSLSASFVGQPTRRNVTCVSFAMFLFRLVLSRCALLSLPLKTRSVSLARPLSRLQRAA